MLSKENLKEKLQNFLDSKKLFIIDINISYQNDIEIIIDGDNYVNIDDCTEVSRYVESFLNRDEEDFSLIVSSPDANKPLLLPRQYPKHIGKNILIHTIDNKEIKGKIISANLQSIELLVKQKEKKYNKKETKTETITIFYDNIKKARILLPF